MKLYTFEFDGQRRIGAERGGRLVDFSASPDIPQDMISLLRGGDAAMAAATRVQAGGTITHAFSDVSLLAPVPRPGKILCSGLNYKSHIEEEPGSHLLDDPRFFSKLPSCVIGPGAAIRHPGQRFQVDYEVELAIVFGTTCYRVSQQHAMRHVFGYTILHDVSARWIQFKDANETMGKNFDTFAPMGPCLVTADEIPDPRALRLTLRLNGHVMQDRTNEDWCFPLPRMIEWLSMAMTLEPGDVMSTGTPAGVGCFRNPPIYLTPGDVCELSIDGIGTLVNRVEADPYTFLTQPTS